MTSAFPTPSQYQGHALPERQERAERAIVDEDEFPAQRVSSSGNPFPPMSQEYNVFEELVAFYKKYHPSKSDDDIKKAVEVYQGKYDAMWSALEQKYGPRGDGQTSSSSPQSDFQSTTLENAVNPYPPALEQYKVFFDLVAYYKRYAPEKRTADVKMAVDKFAGKYDAMWTNLEAKYGPRADDGTNSSPQPSTVQPSTTLDNASNPFPPNVEQHRVFNDLVAYYRKYAPQKHPADLKVAVDKYAGNYETMWSTLEKKYGPREASTNSASSAGYGQPPPSAPSAYPPPPSGYPSQQPNQPPTQYPPPQQQQQQYPPPSQASGVYPPPQSQPSQAYPPPGRMDAYPPQGQPSQAQYPPPSNYPPPGPSGYPPQNQGAPGHYPPQPAPHYPPPAQQNYYGGAPPPQGAYGHYPPQQGGYPPPPGPQLGHQPPPGAVGGPKYKMPAYVPHGHQQQSQPAPSGQRYY